MTLLDFQEETGKARPKFLVVAMVIAAFAFVGTLRNTLAADIAINLNESVEFGQGVAMTTACDDEITLTPHATFDNTPGVESFMFTSLRVSGIDSSEGKCSGKTFTIRAYGEDGILDLFNYREVLFSDPPDILQDTDYNAIEITNYGGDFVWTSGGTDGDDVIDVDNSDLTDTAFTLNLVSIAATITRTPLARADSIKAITIETYGQDDLVGQTLSSSQVGLFLSPYDLDLSFDFIGDTVTSTCEPESCIPYIVLQDWIDRILDSDVDYVNQNRGDNGAPPLNREQIGEGFSARFEYFPDAEPNYRWNLVVSFLGNEQVIPGYIIGFNGSTGAFLPPGEEMGTQVILFSVDNSLSTNATIGQFTPYGDQPTRNIPIRDFLEIWNYSEVRYMQGQG